MKNRYRNETNDLRDGAEFDCRHGVDLDWPPVPYHMHPHYEFYLLIRGNVQMLIEDESFDAHPMDLFIFPPGVLHRALVLGSSIPYERAYLYITRKALGSIDDTYRVIDSLLNIIRVLTVTNEDVLLAFQTKARDFEDCLMAVCARSNHCDGIVTRNKKDFVNFGAALYTPAELLRLFADGKNGARQG